MKTKVRQSSRNCYHEDIVGAKESQQSEIVAEYVLVAYGVGNAEFLAGCTLPGQYIRLR